MNIQLFNQVGEFYIEAYEAYAKHRTLNETKQTLFWIDLNYCAFRKHANSEVLKPPSQLRFWLPLIIITNTNY